jgi:hypothetical protein
MNKSFVSKALTLFTIAVGRGRYSRSRVAEVSNLPVTKIDGTLARAFKTRCAERSAGRVRVPPSGLAVLYRITPLGIDNLRWFLKAGLISSGEYDVEVVLRNARSSQPGVRWLRRE